MHQAACYAQNVKETLHIHKVDLNMCHGNTEKAADPLVISWKRRRESKGSIAENATGGEGCGEREAVLLGKIGWYCGKCNRRGGMCGKKVKGER